jgi:transketolase
VPVLLGAALKTPVPLIVLHLTRPPITIPDRARLGIPSHFEAARGAYLMRDYAPGMARGGAIIVQGSSAMAGIVRVLPELEARGWNVKIVCGASPELFAMQPEAYRARVLSPADRMDSTFISTQSRGSMQDWSFNPLAGEYALTSDWDDRWRTGGTVDEVIEEAHLSPEWLLKGIELFVHDRSKRLEQIKADVEAARAG